MTYAVITTDGDLTLHDGVPKYERLKQVVGGYIEALDIPGLGVMWLNEEGKLDALPWNQRATWITKDGPKGPAGLAEWDYIAGNVVITGGPDRNGETTGLSDESVRWLKVFDVDRPKPER